MVESEKLYQEIKNYFLKEHRPQIVIQISNELPMDLWKVSHVLDVDEMIEVRSQLQCEEKDFAGFIWYEDQYHFYFVDSNMLKDIEIDSGHIFHFNDYTFDELDMKAVAEELHKLIQGS